MTNPMDQARGVDRRGTAGRAVSGPGNSSPIFIHLILGPKLPITRPILEAAIARIREELLLALPQREGLGFFISTHDSIDRDDELLQLGPRDLPLYLLAPESARDTQRLIDRHVAGQANVNAVTYRIAAQAMTGGTADSDEHGISVNFDVAGVRRGVNFVRVEKVTGLSPADVAISLGETALHELGHHLLDPGAHRFGGLMAPGHPPSGPKRHFSAGARILLRSRIDALPRNLKEPTCPMTVQ